MATVTITDDKGTEIDEDVFPELATDKDLCFVVQSDAGQHECNSSKLSHAYSLALVCCNICMCMFQIPHWLSLLLYHQALQTHDHSLQ